MNSCTIIGNLGDNPTLRQTPSSRSVTNFSVAVDRRYQKTGGEGEDRRTVKTTDWVDVVVWNGLAEVCSRYLQKGSKVCVEGSIRSRVYEDRNGVRHKTFELNADKVHFLGNIRSTENGDTTESIATASIQ
jgi:single-strand DNA-binding protein